MTADLSAYVQLQVLLFCFVFCFFSLCMKSRIKLNKEMVSAPNGSTIGMELIYMKNAAVFGSGAFGTALATVLSRKCETVRVWHINPEEASRINISHENHFFLKGFRLPTNVEYSANVGHVLLDAQLLLFVVPTQFFRHFLEQHGKELWAHVSAGKIPVLICSKGIERSTLKFPTEILSEFFPGYPVSVLAGPSFAAEIVLKKSTSVCIASRSLEEAARLQRMLTTADRMFFCLTSTDVIGCEVASAMKNVVAIAAGILAGQGMGNNARAALITRALIEIRDVTKALGGDGSATYGLAGVGDLLLTSSSELSRNFTVGKQLGEGKTYEEIMKTSKAVAEGTSTAESLNHILVKHNIHARICSQVYKIIYEKKEVTRALHHFLGNSSLASEGLDSLFKSKL